jgi:RecB family exonuclease
VITPRRTRLVRVPDLHAFRHAIREYVAQALRPAVVVPTKSAARQLGTGVTRDELYGVLRSRLADPPPLLAAIERDVIAQAAARAVADSGAPLSFQLRPGLVAEMLRFYDHLRRQSQSVARFEALIADAIGGGDDADTGAARLRQQTRFLADTFHEYERRVRETGAYDEHLLRDRLVRDTAADPIRHVVVTVGDWIADENGLYVADFDLLSRIPGLEVLDVVATEGILRSGFRERLDAWLPGLEETGLGSRDSGLAKPVLVVPSNPESHIPNPDQWFTYRDREEELIAVTRMIEAPLERTAVVYKRPLPYLYLAGEVFGDAAIPHHVSDALPLATEPTAAAFDLILESAASDFTRDSLVALLRSPHFAFDVDRGEISALDRALSDARYLGGLERLETLGAGSDPSEGSDPSGTAVVSEVARELAPLQTSRPASEQIRTLLEFWSAHARPLVADDPFAARELRARAAIVGALERLATVHAAQGDPAWKIEDVSVAVRRAVEEQTFVPESSERGLQLLDDQAARYGDFDLVFIVGLVEHEWPESPRRNIFYPPSLLRALGWPTERDRRAAADARFLDLLASARRRTIVSTFTLDDDALVMPSLQLDEIPRARLSSVPTEWRDAGPAAAEPSGDAARQWMALRTARSDAAAPMFHGSVGPRPPRPWSVSALETYVGCPFKFFAQHVLDLDEEPEDEEVMDPRRQGQLVHDVFERFFKEWQAGGNGTITSSNLDAARELFEEVVDRALVSLSPAEAALERTRLLGSPAAAGLGEAVFRMEAERPARVVERLLEWRLEGSFAFSTADGTRELSLRGKADRIDLLEDGSFRLIDYKLGWPPDRTRALQLPIYGVCAEQRLASYRGRSWSLGEAAYLAFKGPRRVVPLFAPGARDKAVADAQQRLVDAVDAIERGEFPPTPDDVYRCETCTFAAVCRKDYVGDV